MTDITMSKSMLPGGDVGGDTAASEPRGRRGRLPMAQLRTYGLLFALAVITVFFEVATERTSQVAIRVQQHVG